MHHLWANGATPGSTRGPQRLRARSARERSARSAGGGNATTAPPFGRPANLGKNAPFRRPVELPHSRLQRYPSGERRPYGARARRSRHRSAPVPYQCAPQKAHCRPIFILTKVRKCRYRNHTLSTSRVVTAASLLSAASVVVVVVCGVAYAANRESAGNHFDPFTTLYITSP